MILQETSENQELIQYGNSPTLGEGNVEAAASIHATDGKSVRVPALSTQQRRVRKGLCPNCGKEAAPYYLCGKCRQISFIRRGLNSGTKAGVIKKTVAPDDKRKKMYAIGNKDAEWNYREARDGDKRLKPRIGKIPVDVEKELIELFKDNPQGLAYQEIIEAWGALRVREGRVSAARDMFHIITSRRKRRGA